MVRQYYLARIMRKLWKVGDIPAMGEAHPGKPIRFGFFYKILFYPATSVVAVTYQLVFDFFVTWQASSFANFGG